MTISQLHAVIFDNIIKWTMEEGREMFGEFVFRHQVWELEAAGKRF